MGPYEAHRGLSLLRLDRWYAWRPGRDVESVVYGGLNARGRYGRPRWGSTCDQDLPLYRLQGLRVA